MFEIKKYRKLINLGSYIVMFFLFVNLNFENDSTYIICQFVYIGYLLMLLKLINSRFFTYVYEPPIFFLLFAFLYEFLKFPFYFKYSTVSELIEASNLITPVYEIKDYYANSIMLLLYESVCIIIMISFYLFSRDKINFSINITRVPTVLNDRFFVVLSVIFLLLGFYGLYSITGGNILLLLTRRSGNSEASELLSSNYLVSFSSIFVLLTIPTLIGVRYISKRKWKVLLLIYFPAMLLSYLTTGARGFILYSILTTFILIASDVKTKVNLVKIGLFGGVFILIFSILGLVRRSSSDTDNSFINGVKNRSEVEDKWYFEISSYQLQFRDEMVFENAERVGYLYGKTYLNLIFFPIPRSFVGDLKPNFTDREVGVNFWNRDDVGLPLNSMTESYYNFGFYGVFVFMIIGIIMSRFAFYVSSNRFLTVKCMAVVLLFYVQTWTTTYLVYVLQYLIIIYLPLKLIIFNNSKK